MLNPVLFFPADRVRECSKKTLEAAASDFSLKIAVHSRLACVPAFLRVAKCVRAWPSTDIGFPLECVSLIGLLR